MRHVPKVEQPRLPSIALFFLLMGAMISKLVVLILPLLNAGELK